jgi:hypothetical protein
MVRTLPGSALKALAVITFRKSSQSSSYSKSSEKTQDTNVRVVTEGTLYTLELKYSNAIT